MDLQLAGDHTCAFCLCRANKALGSRPPVMPFWNCPSSCRDFDGAGSLALSYSYRYETQASDQGSNPELDVGSLSNLFGCLRTEKKSKCAPPPPTMGRCIDARLSPFQRAPGPGCVRCWDGRKKKESKLRRTSPLGRVASSIAVHATACDDEFVHTRVRDVPARRSPRLPRRWIAGGGGVMRACALVPPMRGEGR